MELSMRSHCHCSSLVLFAATLNLVITSFIFCYADQSTITHPHTHHYLNNETDHLSLLAFKSHIYYDPHNVLSSWNQSSHFCTWAGVTCSRRHPQRVRALKLCNQQLSGTLSPQIANLSFLTSLSLIHNNFHGEIPKELGRLRRLQTLYLGYNSFCGQLPKNLTSCSELRSLFLYGSNLEGNLLFELGTLTKLLYLNLGDNNFTGLIPLSLGNLSSLTYLYLSENNLQGNINIDDLGKLVNIQYLYLGVNNFTPAASMPAFVFNLSALCGLDLSSLQVHGRLPPDLGLKFPNLSYLWLQENLFSGPIPSSLANCTRLEFLMLGQNDFTGHVPLNLGRLQCLRSLYISQNQLDGDLSFVTSLTNCSNLEALVIEANQFRDVLPNSIANVSTQLKVLMLGENQIYGSIPRGIEKLSNLQTLYMDDALLTGPIDVHFGELHNLETLALHNNTLTGEIQTSLGNLTRLSKLYLSTNDLDGIIPSSLRKCQNLQQLYLHDCKLNGTLYTEILNIPSLLAIDISMNSLTGQLTFTEKSNQIVYLDVSQNKFSGEIPATLANYMSLQTLLMCQNFFQGSIPFLGDISSLQVLDLSHNSLFGSIPEYLERLGNLKYLNLSFNKLEGEVPKHGIFQNVSAFSIVGNNKLCGGVQRLQLPVCPTHSIHKRLSFRWRIIITVVVVAVIFCLVVLICFLANIKWKKKFSKLRHSIIPSLKEPFPEVTYAELFKATEGFSSSHLIGTGSFGLVYKGFVNHIEALVVIKVLNLQLQRAMKSFIVECEALRSIKHRNIINILTVCSSIDFEGNDFKAIVFEHMPNKSLDSWLHQNIEEEHQLRNLTLIQRIHIAIDVASAVDYLHNHCPEPIIHCDLKPSNVLLDNDMVAHVSDFGLAKVLFKNTVGYTQAQCSSLLKGTIGYIAPEYGLSGEISTYGDVYSYGILLLEMIFGKRPSDEMFKDNYNLHEFAKMILPEQVTNFVDPQLLLKNYRMTRDVENSLEIQGVLQECLISLLKVGVSCSKESPKERMEIRDVIKDLHKIKDLYLSWSS